jgi:polysaccharide biosynthesis/export protein
VLLTAVSLAGCAGSLSKNSGNSVGSNEQLASYGTATNQVTGTRSDRPVSQAAHAVGAVPAPGVYTIGPTDVLEISVFKVPELSKTVQVAETGSINLPLVGEVPAAGKTAQQLERDLTAKLGATYLQNPQVTVMVAQNNSQHVTIEGAVKKPGVYPIKGNTTLVELVATAGGLEQVSDSTVLVLRTSGGKRSAATFNVAAIEGGNAQDPTIQPGDLVVAGTSAIKQGFNAILRALPVAGLFTLL